MKDDASSGENDHGYLLSFQEKTEKHEQSESSHNGCGQGVGAGGTDRLATTDVLVSAQDIEILLCTIGINRQNKTIISRFGRSGVTTSPLRVMMHYICHHCPRRRSALAMWPNTGRSPLKVPLIVESNGMQSPPTELEH